MKHILHWHTATENTKKVHNAKLKRKKFSVWRFDTHRLVDRILFNNVFNCTVLWLCILFCCCCCASIRNAATDKTRLDIEHRHWFLYTENNDEIFAIRFNGFLFFSWKRKVLSQRREYHKKNEWSCRFPTNVLRFVSFFIVAFPFNSCWILWKYLQWITWIKIIALQLNDPNAKPIHSMKLHIFLLHFMRNHMLSVQHIISFNQWWCRHTFSRCGAASQSVRENESERNVACKWCNRHEPTPTFSAWTASNTQRGKAENEIKKQKMKKKRPKQHMNKLSNYSEIPSSSRWIYASHSAHSRSLFVSFHAAHWIAMPRAAQMCFITRIFRRKNEHIEKGKQRMNLNLFSPSLTLWLKSFRLCVCACVLWCWVSVVVDGQTEISFDVICGQKIFFLCAKLGMPFALQLCVDTSFGESYCHTRGHLQEFNFRHHF